MKKMKFNFRFTELLSKRYDFPNKWYSIIVIILLLSSAILLGVDSLNSSTDPEYYDTTAYLGEANFINNYGGITNFVNLCIKGTYKQANQHPLYILLLTPFASTDISFLIKAKFINAVIGIIALAFLYIIGRKMYGDLIASIAVFAMTLNYEFIKWIAIVASESLLVLFSILCIYYIVKGFSNNKFWIYAGIFAGLAFITKVSGLFLIPGFILAALGVYKLKTFQNKYFWSFFIFFILISSPLLIRNIVVYQDPLFSTNKYVAELGRDEAFNTAYMVYSSEIGADHWEFEKVENKKENSKIESSYFNILKRVDFKKIIIIQGKLLLNTLNISLAQSYLTRRLSLLFALVLILLFIIGILREKNLGAKIYIFTTIIIFMIVLSFNRPIARYFLPIIPFMWIYIALGIFTILELTNKMFFEKTLKINIFPFIPHLIIFLLILNLARITTIKTFSNPLKSVEYSENRADIVNWLKLNLNKNDKYTLGPNLNWQLKNGTWLVPPVPARENFSKLNSFVKSHSIQYVIIGKNNLIKYRGYNYQELTKDYFKLDPDNGVVSIKDIENWTLVYKNKKKPVEYLVYKVD